MKISRHHFATIVVLLVAILTFAGCSDVSQSYNPNSVYNPGYKTRYSPKPRSGAIPSAQNTQQIAPSAEAYAPTVNEGKATLTPKDGYSPSESAAQDAAESAEAKREFMGMTGFPDGRPGYVVEYIVPLKEGGANSSLNMQWKQIGKTKTEDIWK